MCFYCNCMKNSWGRGAQVRSDAWRMPSSAAPCPPLLFRSKLAHGFACWHYRGRKVRQVHRLVLVLTPIDWRLLPLFLAGLLVPLKLQEKHLHPGGKVHSIDFCLPAGCLNTQGLSPERGQDQLVKPSHGFPFLSFFFFLRSAAERRRLPSSQQDPWGSWGGVWQLMSSGSSQLFLLDLQTHSGGRVFHAVTYSKLLGSAFFQTVTHRMSPFSRRHSGTGCLIKYSSFWLSIPR